MKSKKFKPTVKAKAPQDSNLRGIGTFDWSHPLISAQKRLASLLFSEDSEPSSAGRSKKVKCPLCGRRVNVKNNRLSPHYKTWEDDWNSYKAKYSRFYSGFIPPQHCSRTKLIE